MNLVPNQTPPIEFGKDALDFVQEELRMAAGEFEGPLAVRLVDLELRLPFGFLSPDVERAAHAWRSGGIDDGASDRCLAIALSEWLHQPDPGRLRLVALEDPLARHSDAGIDPRAMHFGDRVYHAAHQGDSPDDIERAFRQLPGYPGVGVATRPLAGAVASGELSDDALDALANAAVAVLVRAWDDEAFLIAPVGNALARHDFKCWSSPGFVDT